MPRHDARADGCTSHRRRANYEGFYASVFYRTSRRLATRSWWRSRAATGVWTWQHARTGRVYLFEFKVAEMAPPGSALAQLQERDYAAKYRDRGEPIHLIGVEFSRQTRNVAAFEVAEG